MNSLFQILDFNLEEIGAPKGMPSLISIDSLVALAGSPKKTWSRSAPIPAVVVDGWSF
jgi:hypothetical protein